MISNSSIKTSIISKFNQLKPSMSESELLATEIVFYKYILSFIKNNDSQINDVQTIISSYANDYLHKFVDLKNKYTCYLAIINFLKKIGTNNLLSMRENDIDTVYELYLNGKEIDDFNIQNFSTGIYSAGNLDSEDYKYLENIHFNVMVPIFKYYKKLYNIKETDMKIVDSLLESNVGKKITFCIENVPITKIYSDITGKHIPIKYYKINLKYPNIEIINF